MTTTIGDVASLAARAGGTVAHRVRLAAGHSPRQPGDAGHPASGWLVVSVLRDPSDIDVADLPAPLAEFGDRIEARVRPAPGDRGTELGVRLRDGVHQGSAVSRLTGNDPQADLRSALRKAKQLLEVGEVLAVDPAPHGKRTATPGGALLEAFTRAAPKAGVR